MSQDYGTHRPNQSLHHFLCATSRLILTNVTKLPWHKQKRGRAVSQPCDCVVSPASSATFRWFYVLKLQPTGFWECEIDLPGCPLHCVIKWHCLTYLCSESPRINTAPPPFHLLHEQLQATCFTSQLSSLKNYRNNSTCFLKFLWG